MTKSAQRLKIGKQLRVIIDGISRMSLASCRKLRQEYSGLSDSNCAWYEFRVKAFVLETLDDRIMMLERQKATRVVVTRGNLVKEQ